MCRSSMSDAVNARLVAGAAGCVVEHVVLEAAELARPRLRTAEHHDGRRRRRSGGGCIAGAARHLSHHPE